ncbi:MAG: hypothetical protein ACREGG_00075 [Candidatus Saccharimonadales bacterium]
MADKKSSFDELDKLVGDWKMESTVNDVPVIRGKITFAWLAGRAFLIQHATVDPPLPTTSQIWIDNSPFPIVAIISLDDLSGNMYYNYADGWGVHRVYQMSFKDNVWKFWGQAHPKFYQRSTGKLSKDGQTIQVHIERSADNKSWQTDFHSTYTRIH